MTRRGPRTRYIAFEVNRPEVGRALVAAFQSAIAGWPWDERPHVLFVEGRGGLVKCTDETKDRVIRLLNSLRVAGAGVAIRTVGTSGTIRGAKMQLSKK